MHQDHMGGFVAGGRPNFLKAEVYVDRRDVAYWTDSARKAAPVAPSLPFNTDPTLGPVTAPPGMSGYAGMLGSENYGNAFRDAIKDAAASYGLTPYLRADHSKGG